MANIVPISVPPKRLAQSMTSASMLLKVGDILGWDGEPLQASDFGTVAYAVLRDSTNTLIEIVEFDPSTIADAAGITLTKRGLPFEGSLTEVASNKLTWVKNETTVELGSNPPQLLNRFVRTIGSPTIDEILRYSTALTPTDARDIVTKGYVDGVALGGSLTINQLIMQGVAGEVVAAGDLIALDESDGEWYLTDATDLTSFDGRKLGIAQGAGVNGGTISGGVLTRGIDTNQSSLTLNAELYIGNTSGSIVTTPGTYTRQIGFSISDTEMYFDPDYTLLPLLQEKQAIGGGSFFGTPSSTNKFLTQKFITNGGDGSDGILSVTSGTTTISSGGTVVGDYQIFQYSAITVSSGATLKFSSAYQNKIIVVLCSGNATIAGTVDVSGLGGLGGALSTDGQAGVRNWNRSNGKTNTSDVEGTTVLGGNEIYNAFDFYVGNGSGGGGGVSDGRYTGGVGGNGGGSLILSVAGTLNISGATFLAKGVAGTNATNETQYNNGFYYDPATGGGGGGGGTVWIFAKAFATTTADYTITCTGGLGGRGTYYNGVSGGGSSQPNRIGKGTPSGGSSVFNPGGDGLATTALVYQVPDGRASGNGGDGQGFVTTLQAVKPLLDLLA